MAGQSTVAVRVNDMKKIDPLLTHLIGIAAIPEKSDESEDIKQIRHLANKLLNDKKNSSKKKFEDVVEYTLKDGPYFLLKGLFLDSFKNTLEIFTELGQVEEAQFFFLGHLKGLLSIAQAANALEDFQLIDRTGMNILEKSCSEGVEAELRNLYENLNRPAFT